MANETRGNASVIDVDDDDEYYVPLVDQRVFGAGLKRKRITFVPATSDDPAVKPVKSPSDTANRYLSIVLPQQSSAVPLNTDSSAKKDADDEPLTKVGMLDNASNDTSIANQITVEHSHTPSHLDRSRLGLRYLQDYGWDPDDRQGLGSRREGIRIPVKAIQKRDTAGLGLFLVNDDEVDNRTKKTLKQNSSPASTPKLNAKQVRQMEEEKKKKGEKLRQSVYGEDWSRYLGPE